MNEELHKDERFKRIIRFIDESDLASIKSVVSGIIEIINDPNSSAKDLKGLIQIDPPLTAKVLKLANSAYYSPRIRISEIDNAIIWIGFDALKELALRQKVCEIFDSESSVHGYSRNSLWKHSIAVAMLAKMIYRREFGERGENVYAAGLLHDIGIIAEDQFFQDDFRHILRDSESNKVNLRSAEEDHLGYTHADIGRAIAGHWNFPRELVMTIGCHHDPGSVTYEFAKMASALYVSDYLCQERGIGYRDEPYPDETVFQKCLKTLGVRLQALDMIVNDMASELSVMEDQGIL